MSILVDVSIKAASIVDAAWARAIANRERLSRRLDLQAVREETSRDQLRRLPWEQLFTTPTPLQYRPDEPVAYPATRETVPPVDPGDYEFPLPPLGDGETEIFRVPLGFYWITHFIYSYDPGVTSGSPFSSLVQVDSTAEADGFKWGPTQTISDIQIGAGLFIYRGETNLGAPLGMSRIQDGFRIQIRGISSVNGPAEPVGGLPPPSLGPLIPLPRMVEVPPPGYTGD